MTAIPSMDEIINKLASGTMDVDPAKVFISQHMHTMADYAGQRGYFSGEAMNALMSRSDSSKLAPADIADSAVAIADAVIARLNKVEPTKQ